mgnify:CR=1 FL=1
MFTTRFQFVEDEFAHLDVKRWFVFNAESPEQIAALKHLSPTIYQTFAPSVTDLQSAGYDVVQSVPSDFDVAVVLSDGKVIAKGTPSELVKNPNAQTAYFGDSFKFN